MLKTLGTLFVYEISPMDFGWDTLPTMNQYLKSLVDSGKEFEGSPYGGLAGEIQRAIEQLQMSTRAAHKVGWEGDFRTGHEPRVIVLPDADSPFLAFVWKQENNGDTFVVSPRPLPWLDTRDHDGRPDEIAVEDVKEEVRRRRELFAPKRET